MWQRALDLAVDAAPLARSLAAEGYGGLANDLFRAATAAPAHIAAGSVAGTRTDHQHALGAALGALARFETLVAAAERLAPNAAAGCAPLLADAGDITRSLRAFARAIGGAPATSPPAPARRHAGAEAHPDDRLPSIPAAARPLGLIVPDPAMPDPATPDDVAPDDVAPNSDPVHSAPPTTTLAPAPAADGVAPPISARPARGRRTRNVRSAGL